MSDFLPPSAPDDAPRPDDIPAQTVPDDATAPETRANSAPETDADAASETVTASQAAEEEIEIEVENTPEGIAARRNPEALANDRAGFKFLAIGFAIFFALIAICGSIVALVMKSMGI